MTPSINGQSAKAAARRAAAIWRFCGLVMVAIMLMPAQWAARAEGGDANSSARPGGLKPAVREESPKQSESLASAAKGTVHIDHANRIELHVTAMPIGDVLRMLADESRRNIIASNSVTGVVTANLYDTTLEDALEAILRGSGLGYVQRGDFIFVHTQDELAKIRESQREIRTRVFKLKYLEAADAKVLLTPLMSKGGLMAVTPASGDSVSGGGGGGGSSSGSSGGGGSSGGSSSGGGGGGGGGGLSGGNSHSDVAALVVTDESDRLDHIARVLAELDTRPRQVLIEATILRASLTEDNALGVDFTTLGGVDFTQVQSSSPADQSITTGNLPTKKLDSTTFTARTSLTGGVPSGGLSFGIIKNNVGVFLRALEQVADTTVIANPKVLAVNKQKGEVIVGRRDGYVTTTTTATASIQNVDFLETGTQLRFRPFILDDQFIRMEIHPEDSTGGLTASNLPFKQTTEVTTNILIRDGHTILIGGLFREVTAANRGQLPFLGNIPLVGALFRQTGDNTVREEVIILLTVRVVKGEPEEREGEDLTRQVERRRVGMRQGLQFYGRERLAQAHYRWALEHLAKGHLARAQWDAELAVANAPQQVHAVELLDQIRGRRAWDEDASAVRFHLQRLIAADQGVVLPPQGRPAPPFVMPDHPPIPPFQRGGEGGVGGGFDENGALPVAPEAEGRK